MWPDFGKMESDSARFSYSMRSAMRCLPWILCLLAVVTLGCGGGAAAKKKSPAKKGAVAKKTQPQLKAKGATPVAKKSAPALPDEGTKFPLPAAVDEEPGERSAAPPRSAAVEPSTPAIPVPAASQNGANVQFITEDFVGAVVIRPQRLLKSPLLPPSMPKELFDGLVSGIDVPLSSVGVTTATVEEVTVLFTDPASGLQAPTFILRMNRPLFPDTVMLLNDLALEETRQGGSGPFYGLSPDNKTACWRPNRQTLILGPTPAVEKTMASKGANSPLIELLARTDVSRDATAVFVMSDKLRESAKTGAASPPGEPSDFTAAEKILAEGGASATIRLDLSGDPLLQLTLSTRDEKYPPELQKAIQGFLALVKKDMTNALGPIRLGGPDVQQSVTGALEELLGKVEFQVRGKDLVATATTPAGLKDSLAKAFATATKESALLSHANDLKQYGVALHTYHDVWRCWPISDVKKEHFDKNGKPFLSWRVHVLPYMEQQPLYDKFHLDEPWDSEHNLKLAEYLPPYLKRPGLGLKTTMLMFAASGTLQEGKAAPRDFKDGIDQTIFIVEAGDDKAVFWTKPEDLEFNPKDPAAALGNLKDDFFLALIGDGRVVKLRRDMPAENFLALITRSGGEKVNWMDFQAK